MIVVDPVKTPRKGRFSLVMRIFAVSALAFLSSACTGLNPTLDTALAVGGRTPAFQYAKGFEYLEVSVHRHRTVMALGSRSLEGGALIEQWFSGQGEMLELRDGRLHRVLGMTSEVRRTDGTPPAWAELSSASGTRTWLRERQVMPGYQRRQEQIVTNVVQAPPGQGPRWIHERVSTRLVGGERWHYTDKFQIQDGRVLASEQCISPDLCMKLRHLGVVRP